MTPAATPTTPMSRPRPTDLTKHADQLWSALDQAIDDRAEWMVRFRRQIHANPEASGRESATTALVAATLREHGLTPTVMKDGVGVIVDVDLGAAADSFVAIRAELDCVNVDDEKKAPYASRNPGLCHACGHDAHTTMALTTALALHDLKKTADSASFKHNIRAIFQPAEETATGALSMIKQGAVNNVKAMFAVHVEPFVDVGRIAMRKGALTSACKAFHITIKGRSGHSARPYQAIDPIPAAVAIVDQFYQLGPRSMDSRYPLALTVTSIASGDSYNVIPDDAVIKGSLRTARLEDLEAVQAKMAAIIKGVAQSTGCEIELVVPHYAPPTNNDPALIDIMANATAHIAPNLPGMAQCAVDWLEVPSMGAEDFAFYQEVVPGAIVRLGVGLPRKENRKPLHSSLFDINEAALPIGAKLLAHSAVIAACQF